MRKAFYSPAGLKLLLLRRNMTFAIFISHFTCRIIKANTVKGAG